MNHPECGFLARRKRRSANRDSASWWSMRGKHRQPQWIDAPKVPWGLHHLWHVGIQITCSATDHRVDYSRRFREEPANSIHFLLTASLTPHEREFVLQQGTRYRLVMRNRTDDAHPMHLHRHLWELAEINGRRPPGLSRIPSSSRITVALSSTSQPISPVYLFSTAISNSTWIMASKALFHCV